MSTNKLLLQVATSITTSQCMEDPPISTVSVNSAMTTKMVMGAEDMRVLMYVVSA